jgi:hypothetical protein
MLRKYKCWAVLADSIQRARSGIPWEYPQSRGPRPIPFEVPWILEERNGISVENRPGPGVLMRRIPLCPWYLPLHSLCDLPVTNPSV